MAAIKPVFTYEDLLQLPDDGKRYEILEGDLAVSPSPNTKHQGAVIALGALLYRAQQAGYGRAFTGPTDVVFDQFNIAVPDVLFVRTERLGIVGEANIQGAPDLIMEVLSPSTSARDLGVKMRMYARYGVPYYWVADAIAQTVHPYELREGTYVADRILRAGDRLTSPLFPEISIDVAEVFA